MTLKDINQEVRSTPLPFHPNDFDSYVDVLKSEFANRKNQNPDYSLRSFSLDLGLSFPRLSQLMNGRSGLSISAAKKIAKSLGLGPEFTDFFVTLCASKHSRSDTDRELALTKLRKIRATSPVNATHDSKIYISEWYYLPILELFSLNQGEIPIENLARVIGISIEQVERAIQHLVEIKALLPVANGRYKKGATELIFNSPTPSVTIREFHRQILSRASEAVQTQEIAARKSLSTLITIRKSQVEAARNFLEKVERDFRSKFDAGSDADSLYCLSIQYFKFADCER